MTYPIPEIPVRTNHTDREIISSLGMFTCPHSLQDTALTGVGLRQHLHSVYLESIPGIFAGSYPFGGVG